MKIGVVGFGSFGKFLAGVLVDSSDLVGNSVRVVNRMESSYEKELIGNRNPKFDLFRMEDIALFSKDLDIIILAVSISSLEEVLQNCPVEVFESKLVVDVCSVKVYARDIMTQLLPASADILCTHPMFGPRSAGGRDGLCGKKFMYDRIRISEVPRMERFLNLWTKARCTLVPMSCEQHDEFTAKSQFVTHFLARSCSLYTLEKTPIDTPSYENLCDLVSGLSSDSSDLFCSLFKYNPYAACQLGKLKEAIDCIEMQLLKDA